MAFTPHPSASLGIRSLQRTMYIQVGYAVIFGAINAAAMGHTDYSGVNDGPPGGLIVLQFVLGAAILGCAVGLGRLASWARPATYAAEGTNLLLGIYALTSVHSAFVAGFILSIYALVKVSSGDVTQCLQRGPVAGMTNGYPPPPSYGQAPYGQAPYGQPPYGQPPYGQPQYGQPPYQAPNGQDPASQPPYSWPGQAPAPWPGQQQADPPADQPPYSPPR